MKTMFQHLPRLFLAATLLVACGDPEKPVEAVDAAAQDQLGQTDVDTVSAPDTGPPECTLSADCAGKVTLSGPCEVPVCVASERRCEVASLADNTPCDDGSGCTTGELCTAGACGGGKIVDCDDGDVCTQDTCDPSGGCAHAPVKTPVPCDDDYACTSDDACADGKCVGKTVVCDDNNPCTDDDCNPLTGCTHKANAAPCDDGSACSLNDACLAGACVGGSAPVCDDSNGCTDDSCDPKKGCVSLPSKATCDDGDGCTGADACSGGKCVGGNSTCQCQTDTDCVAFEDGDLCNGTLYCDKSAAPFACKVAPKSTVTCIPSSNDCQVVTCVAKSGKCTPSAVTDGKPCADGDFCTTGDACKTGQCKGAAAAKCDDGQSCTTDGCEPKVGCIHLAASGPCDDGQACTIGDVCDGGFCKPGKGKSCNDANPCTNDACVQGKCKSTPNVAACDDGVACTKADICAGGTCGGKPDKATCDDGDKCTDDACDGAQGCLNVANGSCGPCQGIQCLPCASQKPCKKSGKLVPGTCCALGDPLQYLGKGAGDEVVDLEVDGEYAYLCGGFGVRVVKITNPTQPGSPASATQRCQRVGIGPTLANGDRVVYLAHHGDTWVTTPFLKTFHRTTAGAMSPVHTIYDDKILFEGVRYHKGHVWVATHGGGVRIYAADAKGKPSYLKTIGGFTNAWKIEMQGDRAWVADGEGGLRVVDVASPKTAAIVQSLKTTALARDVDKNKARVYTALGGGGVDVFNRVANGKLNFAFNVPPLGSTQAVSVDGGLLAVANWSHVAVYDSATLQLLGTEKVKLYPQFEQDFGVFTSKGIVYTGEWEGLHTLQFKPGFVAPDLWVKEELVSFPPTKGATKAVLVHNRGLVDLEISKIQPADPAQFSVKPDKLVVKPGKAGVVEVTFNGGGAGDFNINSSLWMYTNDPDSGQSPFKLMLIVSKQAGSLNVGDPLPKSFGFLDPKGAGQLSGLKGNVVILAYFALF